MNRNNSTKNLNIKNNNNISENKIFHENIDNITIFLLAEEVMEFFNKMKNLQECIVKKMSGTNQLKIDFERYKKKLIKLLNNIIKNKININQMNSNTKLSNISDNDTIIVNNKNNINSNSYQKIKTMLQINNEIVQLEKFQIINNNNINDKYKEKKDEISNEFQTKYNNLLSEIDNKNKELNKLQDKINKLLLENNDLTSKNKKLDKDNQTLLSKINNININNNDKKIKQNNLTDFDKVNIDDILSSANNINNNSINSNQELFKLTDNEVKLKQENKNLKDLINKCINIIFESIKKASPNLVEEENFLNDDSEDKIKINKNNNQNQKENEEEEEFDMEYINDAVKKFQTFNEEMAKNLKKMEE